MVTVSQILRNVLIPLYFNFISWDGVIKKKGTSYEDNSLNTATINQCGNEWMVPFAIRSGMGKAHNTDKQGNLVSVTPLSWLKTSQPYVRAEVNSFPEGEIQRGQ